VCCCCPSTTLREYFFAYLLCKKIDSSRKEHLSLRTVKGKYFIAFLPFNNLIECGEQKQMSIFWCVKLKGKRTNVWEKREGTSTCLFA
jgi:hypothetical protein